MPLTDHGPCWVVYGVGRGEIEIPTYRRADDGRIPGKAVLEESADLDTVERSRDDLDRGTVSRHQG